MVESYSIYEAKTRFSEIVRKVRRNRRITVTYRGVPIAEIVPLRGSGETLAQRLDRLESEGAIDRCRAPSFTGAFRPVARRRGALARFLSDRD